MRKILMAVLFGILQTLAPAVAEEQLYTVEKDLRFGPLPRQLLDIYTPVTVTNETPVIVYLFGGGFTTGDKGQGRVLGQSYAASGMIVVSPNYRIYPDGTFPDFVEDAAKAIAYTYETLRTNTGEARPLVISGWSAGAYIGALVSYDGRYLEAEGVPPGAIAGFIGLSGPYKGGLCAGSRCPHVFPPGTEADWRVADFVDSTDPPMLLVYGLKDMFVDPKNHRNLAAAGASVGLDVTTLEIAGAYHRDVKDDMADAGTEVRTAVEGFINRVTEP